MSENAPFGNWMLAVAEAAETAGVTELDDATTEQLTTAWGLVRRSTDLLPEELARRVAEDTHLETADLGSADRRAAMLLPGSVARRRNVLPLSFSDREISVATANPLNQAAKREIAELTGRSVTFAVAPPEHIAAAITAVHGSEPRTDDDRPDVGAPAQPEGPHVLVVDDEAGQRALARSLLEGAGYRVDLAKDGPTAIEMLGDDPTYDLVTLDYWMDPMNGLRVLQHIRALPERSDLPVIIVTGAEDRQIGMSLFEAGADDLIAKPIDGPLFILRVRAVLRRRRLA